MIILQTSFSTARNFHRLHHRHLPHIIGHKFSLAAICNSTTIGVVTVGRPVSRILDNGTCFEITRLTTLGTRNLCSILYSHAIKYTRTHYPHIRTIITYTRVDEYSASVKAANFKFDAYCKSKQWSNRKPHEVIDKFRWVYRI